jgi:hypothetical protein
LRKKLKLKQYDIHVSHSHSHPLFIIKACIIMHNMIIEDERNIDDASDTEYEQINETLYVQISHEHNGFL